MAKGNPGRPKGAKDKLFSRRGAGSIKAVYQELIDKRGGHKLMVDALAKGLKDKTKAVAFMELGAKVLDKTDDTGGKHVHFHLYTNVDFEKLRGASRLPALPQ